MSFGKPSAGYAFRIKDRLDSVSTAKRLT